MGKVEVNRSEIAQEISNSVQVPGAGLYRHPNGTEAITLYDPLYGNAQSEAFVRLGFEFVREAKPEEIKSIVEVNLQNREASVVNQSVESTQSAISEAKDKELEELRAYKAQKEADEKAKADAAKKAADGKEGK